MEEWAGYLDGTVSLHGVAPVVVSTAAVGAELAALGPAWLRRADRGLTGSEAATLVHAHAIREVCENEVVHRVLQRGPIALVNGSGLWLDPGSISTRRKFLTGDAGIVSLLQSGLSVDDALERSFYFWAEPSNLINGRVHPWFDHPSEGVRAAMTEVRAPLEGIVAHDRVRKCALIGAALNVLRPAWRDPGPLDDMEEHLGVAHQVLALAGDDGWAVPDEKDPYHRVWFSHDAVDDDGQSALRAALRWAEDGHVEGVWQMIGRLDTQAAVAMSGAQVLADDLATWRGRDLKWRDEYLGIWRRDLPGDWSGLGWLPQPGPDDAWRFAGRMGGGDPWWRSPERRADIDDLLWFAWLLDAWAHRLGRRLLGVHHDVGGLVSYALSSAYPP